MSLLRYTKGVLFFIHKLIIQCSLNSLNWINFGLLYPYTCAEIVSTTYRYIFKEFRDLSIGILSFSKYLFCAWYSQAQQFNSDQNQAGSLPKSSLQSSGTEDHQSDNYRNVCKPAIVMGTTSKRFEVLRKLTLVGSDLVKGSRKSFPESDAWIESWRSYSGKERVPGTRNIMCISPEETPLAGQGQRDQGWSVLKGC